MATDYIKNVKISAVCCAIPKDKLTAEDFYDYLGQDTINRFVKDTGVREKHYSRKRKTMASDLCFVAAEEIFKQKNIDRTTIDAIIFISQTPDYEAPTTSSTLQYRLGLSEECMAYDVNLGCSGYVYGLHLAATKLQSGYLKKVLLLAGDTHEGVSDTPHLNDLLFGDGGSATLIEYQENAIGFRFNLKTIGSGFKAIGATTGLRYAYMDFPSFDPSIHLDGITVFTFSITEVPKQFKSFLTEFNKDIEDYDVVLFHQSNKSMLDIIAKKIKANKNKVPMCLDRYGNTSSASIPNVMSDYYGNINNDNEISFIMSGFGIGLSLGIVDGYIKPNDILPIVFTDITWEEGRSKVIEANDRT